jgi:membrane protein implicated in regulation of membrane protease activity
MGGVLIWGFSLRFLPHSFSICYKYMVSPILCRNIDGGQSMGKFFTDVFNKVLASAIWDTTKPYLLGVTVSAIVAGIIGWLRETSWFVLIPTLILVGVAVNLLSWKLRSKSSATSKDKNPATEKTVSQDTISFEPRRTGVDKLLEEIKNSATVKALWLVGDQADQHDIFATGKPQHLILLDPDGLYLPYHSQLFTKSVGEVVPVIKAVTKRAIEKSIKVRHFDGPIFFTLTIFDPDSAKGYIRVELPIPYSAVHERPSIIVKKTDYPETFKGLINMFDKISGIAKEKDGPTT